MFIPATTAPSADNVFSLSRSFSLSPRLIFCPFVLLPPIQSQTQGTVTATFPGDRLVQVLWDNGSENFYHVKMEQRDVSVVGRVRHSVLDDTAAALGAKEQQQQQQFSFGSSSGGGFGSGLRVASSGGTLFSDAETKEKDREYEMIWSYCGMRLFGIEENRLLERMESDERLDAEGRGILRGLFRTMERPRSVVD